MLLVFSGYKIEAICFTETLSHTRGFTWCHKPECHNMTVADGEFWCKLPWLERFYCRCLFFIFMLSAFITTEFIMITLVAGLLSRGQGPEGPATGHLDTGFSWFPCVNEQMLRWSPRCQVATTCFSCNPPRRKFSIKSCINVN